MSRPIAVLSAFILIVGVALWLEAGRKVCWKPVADSARACRISP